MMKRPVFQRGSWVRYSPTAKLDDGNDKVRYLEIPVLPQVQPQEDDLVLIAQVSDRIDRLAFKHYGDPRLWWILALRNGWDQPMTALSYGRRFFVPSPRYVRQLLVV